MQTMAQVINTMTCQEEKTRTNQRMYMYVREHCLEISGSYTAELQHILPFPGEGKECTQTNTLKADNKLSHNGAYKRVVVRKHEAGMRLDFRIHRLLLVKR